MSTRRSKQPDQQKQPPRKKAVMQAVRELLAQTEELASSADLRETAFLIGVALASLTQEPELTSADGPTIDNCLPGVH